MDGDRQQNVYASNGSSIVSDASSNDNNHTALTTTTITTSTTFKLIKVGPGPITGATITHRTYIDPDTGVTLIESTFSNPDGTTTIRVQPGGRRPTWAQPPPPPGPMLEDMVRKVHERARAAGVWKPHNPAQVAAATAWGMKVVQGFDS